MAPDFTNLSAAGGVLWRDGRHGPEVLLVHRPDHDDWSLPKGKPATGENDIDTAVREVTEETGLPFVLGARLGTVDYPVAGRTKTVTYWAMRLEPGHPRAPAPHDDAEIDDLTWCSVDGACDLLTYSGDRGILETFVRRGRAPVSLILVRHARAGKRSEWTGPDVQRPLDGRGIAQAAAIGRGAGAFAPRRLVSAPLTRCLQTAAPIAARTGLSIEHEQLVSDSALTQHTQEATDLLASWARGAGPATAVVSQGDLIDAALRSVLGSGGQRHPRRKGSMWVFCAQNDQIVAADYYPSMLPRTR